MLMKYFKIILILFIFCFSFLDAQIAASVEWQKTYSGLGSNSPNDVYPDIQQTTDGGYILAGTENDLYPSSKANFSVIKLNSAGDIQWQKSFGGNANDRAHSVRQTTDGGYIIAGETNSNDGDVTGNHGAIDFWVIKLNSSGSLQWQKTFGGSLNDIARSVRQTTDGGYIIAGETTSNNGDITANHGISDYWIVKTDSSGNIQWQKTFGGSQVDKAQEIQQTTDNGYIIAGYSSSNNGDVSGSHGNADFWIIKLNSTGDLQWQKALGGSSADFAYSVRQSSDGGYFVAGSISSSNGDISINHGLTDYWVLKLSATGNIIWEKSFGTSFQEEASGIYQTTDGGCIVTGIKYSIPQEAPTGTAYPDYWVIKLNASGILEWQGTYGTALPDISKSIQQTSDGGFIIGGHTNTASSDGLDFLIIKLSSIQLDTHENNTKKQISIFPNPAKDFVYLTNLPKESTVIVYNSAGRKIFSEKYSQTNISIDTSSFVNGLYFIQIESSEKSIISEKLIISK